MKDEKTAYIALPYCWGGEQHLRATNRVMPLLELQLRGSATDLTDTLWILWMLYRSYGSLDPSAELELQLVGNKVGGIRIYRALMPTFVGMQQKQFNLFYAAHISLSYL
jgi:hypothetical protein